METPWNRARKTAHRTQEEGLGRIPGGQQGVASGRIWRFKRDGRIRDYLIEARTTDAASYRIDEQEFLQMGREAFQTPPGLKPAMQIHMQRVKLIVTSEQDWLDMYEELLQLRERVEFLTEELRGNKD